MRRTQRRTIDALGRAKMASAPKPEVAFLIAAHKDQCALCGITETAVLQFHHRDPKTKVFNIAGAARNRSYEQVAAEIAKCVVLCANCHLLVHAGLKELPE